MTDLEADRTLNILQADFSPTVGARQDQTQARLTVALSQCSCHTTRVSHGREFLIDNENDFRRPLEGVQRRSVGARDVEHGATVRMTRKFEEGTHSSRIEGR